MGGLDYGSARSRDHNVKGVKGKGCQEYAKWLTNIVGKLKSEQLTSEYYEPETKVRIDLHQELGTGQ